VAAVTSPATEATAADEPDNATGDLFAGMSGPASTAPKEPPHGHA
jgi:sec-independent protein translocase protein TatB